MDPGSSIASMINKSEQQKAKEIQKESELNQQRKGRKNQEKLISGNRHTIKKIKQEKITQRTAELLKQKDYVD